MLRFSKCTGTLLVQCSAGNASYDGWDLTSSSTDLGVTFIATCKSLGAVINAIDLNGEETVSAYAASWHCI